jgi:hypothetical protein
MAPIHWYQPNKTRDAERCGKAEAIRREDGQWCGKAGRWDGDEGIRDGDEGIRDGDEGIRDGGKVIRDGDEGIRDDGKVIRDDDEVIRDGGEVIRDDDEGIRDGGEGIRDGGEGIRSPRRAAERSDGGPVLLRPSRWLAAQRLPRPPSRSKRAFLRLALLQHYRCAHCREPLHPDSQADHVVPWSLSADDDDANIQLLCPNCHAAKSGDEAPRMRAARYLLAELVRRGGTGGADALGSVCWGCLSIVAEEEEEEEEAPPSGARTAADPERAPSEAARPKRLGAKEPEGAPSEAARPKRQIGRAHV